MILRVGDVCFLVAIFGDKKSQGAKAASQKHDHPDGRGMRVEVKKGSCIC